MNVSDNSSAQGYHKRHILTYLKKESNIGSITVHCFISLVWVDLLPDLFNDIIPICKILEIHKNKDKKLCNNE